MERGASGPQPFHLVDVKRDADNEPRAHSIVPEVPDGGERSPVGGAKTHGEQDGSQRQDDHPDFVAKATA